MNMPKKIDDCKWMLGSLQEEVAEHENAISDLNKQIEFQKVLLAEYKEADRAQLRLMSKFKLGESVQINLDKIKQGCEALKGRTGKIRSVNSQPPYFYSVEFSTGFLWLSEDEITLC